ncbi:TonB-dependent receptor domain-containing protein [Spirosoma jeollabukense]
MEAKTHIWISFWLVLGMLSGVKAQSTVNGIVHDSKGKPVEFASVVLTFLTDSTQTKGVLTDTLGGFELTGLRPGMYRLRVSSVGFRGYDKPAIQLTDSITHMGEIRLLDEAKLLQDVVVRGERPVVERSLGKLILNVSNSFFKTAASAFDVLKRAPGLRIDPQGGITIKGSVTPVVYIDGKQLPLTAEELKNLPSEDIEQVEIMSNASAQYDGETRAVINIRLKRDKTLGLRGSSYAGASVNRYYGGYELGGSATYKTKKLTYYGRAGYYEGNDFLHEVGKRIVQTTSERNVFSSDAFTRWRNRPLSYQASIDYSLTKNHLVGIMARGLTNQQNDFTDNITRITTSPTGAATSSQLDLPTETRTTTMPTNLAVDLNYRGTLNSTGDQVSVNLDYARYQTVKTQTLRTRYTGDMIASISFPSLLLGQFPSTMSIQSLKADYTHLVDKTMKIDLGAKLSQTKTDSELIYDTLSAAGALGRDPRRSNHFLYKERIVAAYALVEKKLGKTNVEAALRVENTVAEGNSLTLDNVVKRNFIRWLPSLQVQHKFDDENSLSFSYSRKLRRPTFYELNPFQFYTSPFEFSEGNPFLLPATRSSTELAYTLKEITLTATYRVDRNLIAQMPIQDEATKVIRYTRTNLDKSQLVTFDVTAPLAIRKWWKTQHSAVAYYIRTASVFDGGSFDNRAWSFILNGQHVFSLPRGYTLECAYDYSAPSANQFYRSIAYGTVSFGLQKNVLKGAGSIQANFADAFNLYRENFYGIFQDVNVSTTQTRNIQQASIRFTYNFGRSTFSRKSRVSGSSDEENRAR